MEKPVSVTAKGYRRLAAAGHPLAMGDGHVYEHRAVLYEKVGPGAHPCHWCGAVVTWGVDLETDHLDGDKTNNDPANLMPACQACNSWRARHPDTFQPTRVG